MTSWNVQPNDGLCYTPWGKYDIIIGFIIASLDSDLHVPEHILLLRA